MPFFDPIHPVDSHQRHLPHWQQGGVSIFVTWTLSDSLPKGGTTKLKLKRDHWLRVHPKPWSEESEKEYYLHFANPINELLDRGYGPCILRDPALGKITAELLLAHHNEKYQLHSFVIMPNHVHVLFTPNKGEQPSRILQSWKGNSSRQINQIRNTTGTVWQQEYWDRLIRSRAHFEYVVRYIRENPVKAHLASEEFLLWENTELGL